MKLSKPQIDVGLFTDNLDAMQSYYQDKLGLPFAARAEIENVLAQYRHQAGASVLKINTGSDGGLKKAVSGYREIFVARSGIEQPLPGTDPDGNEVTLVPAGWEDMEDLGVRMAVADLGAQHDFMTRVLQCEHLGENRYRSGAGVFIIEHDADAGQSGHWVARGITYVTVHVERVDEVFDGLIERGAAIGETPSTIGDIARISFVCDPSGNWFEVAQRFSLAGKPV